MRSGTSRGSPRLANEYRSRAAGREANDYSSGKDLRGGWSCPIGKTGKADTKTDESSSADAKLDGIEVEVARWRPEKREETRRRGEQGRQSKGSPTATRDASAKSAA